MAERGYLLVRENDAEAKSAETRRLPIADDAAEQHLARRAAKQSLFLL